MNEYDHLVAQFESILPQTQRAEKGTASVEELAQVRACLERLTCKAKPP